MFVDNAGADIMLGMLPLARSALALDGWLDTQPLQWAAMLVATARLHAVLPRRPGRAAQLPVGGSSRVLTAWFPSLSSFSVVGATLTWCAASLTCCQLCRSHFCRLQDL